MEEWWRISNLITALQSIKEKHGDLTLLVYGYHGEIDKMPFWVRTDGKPTRHKERFLELKEPEDWYTSVEYNE